MMRCTLRRRIQEVIAHKNVGKVHVGSDAPSECFGLRIRILGRLHVTINRISSLNSSKPQDGDQDNQTAEPDGEYKQGRTRKHTSSGSKAFKRSIQRTASGGRTTKQISLVL